MNLRNISVYQVTRKLQIESLGELNEALSKLDYREMGAQERVIDGFCQTMPRYRPGTYLQVVGPRELDYHVDGFDRELESPEAAFTDKPYLVQHDGSDFLLLHFFQQTKVVVAEDVRRRVDARVAEIEATQARVVYKAEKDEIRNSILLKILPYAQSRRVHIPLVFLPNDLLLVGATGRKAEDALHALRRLFGTLPVRHLSNSLDIRSPTILTEIAKAQGGEYTFDAKGFRITDDYQVQALDEVPEIARCKNTDISQDSIQEFIANGKLVTHANMAWEDVIIFKTNAKVEFRGLRVDGQAFEESSQETSEDMATAMYSTLLIELTWIQRMLEAFVEVHGGLSKLAVLGDVDNYDVVASLQGFWENYTQM